MRESRGSLCSGHTRRTIINNIPANRQRAYIRHEGTTTRVSKSIDTQRARPHPAPETQKKKPSTPTKKRTDKQDQIPVFSMSPSACGPREDDDDTHTPHDHPRLHQAHAQGCDKIASLSEKIWCSDTHISIPNVETNEYHLHPGTTRKNEP